MTYVPVGPSRACMWHPVEVQNTDQQGKSETFHMDLLSSTYLLAENFRNRPYKSSLLQSESLCFGKKARGCLHGLTLFYLSAILSRANTVPAGVQSTI